MAVEPVLYAAQDGVATLTLNDPARLNPLSMPLLQAALAALRRVDEDRSVRVLVLRATGRAFSAGADLSALADAQQAPAQIDQLMGQGGNPVVLALRSAPVPVLSVVQGIAAGGGVGIALAADVVIAARSASFMLPFVPALGLVPDMGAVWSMQRALGPARTAGLCLLGDRLGAEQAAQQGLIWACIDDAALDAEAARLAARLAALPAHAATEMRALQRQAEHDDLAAQLAYERRRQVALAAGGCFAEGVSAFLRKRRPRFAGRAGD